MSMEGGGFGYLPQLLFGLFFGTESLFGLFFRTESLTELGTCVYGCMCMPQVVDTACLP